ncbi:MAG: OmpH family outer membrane protein [Rhodospirillales bacterium]|nr:OmpH family outer membrane protein [Rhodospirillales bacterium]MCB9995621.1 OmpH family outer membrane protein [Rhodospirillales bacterium]
MTRRNFGAGVLLLAIVAVCLSFTAPAFAEGKIGVVNIQEIMSESKAAKSIQEQLQTKRKAYQEEISKHEQTLREEKKKLDEMSRDTEEAKEELTKKAAEFEKKLMETGKLVEKRKQSLEKAAGDAIAELRKKSIEIISDVADENDYDMILTRQNVVLAQKEMDITPEVMKRLDKSLKEIKLKVE